MSEAEAKLAKVKELLSSLEREIKECRAILNGEKNQPKPTDTPPDLSMVISKDAIGPKGPFRLAESKANEGNAAFDRLKTYLSAHNGNATISGNYVWAFTDGSGNIGWKKTRTVFVG